MYAIFATTSLALCRPGATLTVFTTVNALWLRLLPVAGADRIVTLVAEVGDTDPAYSLISKGRRLGRCSKPSPDRARRAAHSPCLESDGSFLRLRAELEVTGVTPGYFRLFGLTIRGR